ncbi:receptor-type tyrosine-protein phosphatase kappa-like [Littorina saxatilis]|uniref:protein-tyrosine-phosphatase n=1 Tax=Littorina saxatilis TaxID=31220 RepID=A0AAN9AYE8_9CAEN
MATSLLSALVIASLLGPIPVVTQTSTDPCLTCTADQFCFRGTQVLCINCNTACDGCTGPGPDECVACDTGYTLVNGVCTKCPDGQFGVDCNGTCHCLDNPACDHVMGTCTGKCQKGYYKPPLCQDECPDLRYGLDCLEHCHCFNNSVCEKVLGFCPNNLCHPDWTSFGCSKRLPKLSVPPTVTIATCSSVTLTWPTWNRENDFGDLPVAEYRLWWRLNGTNTTWEGYQSQAHDANKTLYTQTLTNQLTGDAYYLFRVDVHYGDDNKVDDKTSPGLVTERPVRVPCSTTTVPPPVTVPIIVGSEIFNTMTATNQPNGSVLITWSIAPNLRQFSWNISLSYQLTGLGNCAVIADSNVTTVGVSQADTSYLLGNPADWRQYSVILRAQGLGSISSANGTEAITHITAEIPPSGNVSNIRVSTQQSTTVILSWDPLPCQQRGGVLVRYDVMVNPFNVSGSTQVLRTTVTSAGVPGLTPYSSYVARVRYVNPEGEGPYGDDFVFQTAQGVPAEVSISSLEPTTNTITVNFDAPFPTNGVITEYYILYSDTATFTSPESLTFSHLHANGSLASTPVLRRLNSDTTYYVKVRGKTSAGYGPYGGAVFARTLQADPYPPRALLQTYRNTTCVSIAWLPPDQTAVTITGYTVTIISQTDGQGETLRLLPSNATEFTRCGLDPGSVYNVSVSSRSGAGTGASSSVVASTEHAAPPPPSAPLLVNVSHTSAAVEIEPVTFSEGPLSAYQLEVDRLGPKSNASRRKRLAEVPGYVTVQLSPDEVRERRAVVIGDGGLYGGYTNVALEAGQRYQVYYVVLSTLNNVTKSSYTRMAAPFATLSTLTPTTAPLFPFAGGDEGDSNAVLIGIILGLIFIILLIIIVIIVIVWWRRRQRMVLTPPPYMELDEGVKVKDAAPREPYDPEKYWNEVTSLRQSRYVVVGRECLPDQQLVSVSTKVAQPGASKINFKKEFSELPHSFPQATTREAEQHPDRNRFPHILPYDHSLALLQPDASSRCRYVNANYVSGYKRQRCYIAAQSPYNDDTAVDFWRLINQHGVKTVVMIANAVEDNIVKCTQFWPLEGKATIGRFYLELQEEVAYADFTVRDVTVREGGEQYGRTVRLFDFTAWPEHGVPADPIPFLDMRYKVRQYHGDETGPILVHCGTGIARTGVFIAVDSLIEQYSAEGRVSVFSMVRKMRKERPMMVRTYKQYVFIYDCLLEEFQAGDTMVDSVTIKDRYHDWTAKNLKTGRSFLRDQFQLLQRLTRGPEPEHFATALLPDNLKRNRYPDVIPSDQHRPELRTPAKLSNTDYINAIFVDGYRRRNQFIVTQTPQHTTLIDFWRMVYDHHVTTIVMMDNYKHEDDTCAEYWPHDVIMKQWEPFFVETTAAFQQENVTIRHLKVTNTLHPRAPPHMVRQFQFNAWSQSSFTPLSKTMALDLMDLVLDYHESSQHPDSPIVVHCEDGATHSGLFVALAVLCERLSEEEEVDVYHVIKHIRRRRTQIVNDYDQYRFCYKTLWDYMNLRMPGGTFTDTLGQSEADKLYGVASLSLTSNQDNLY